MLFKKNLFLVTTLLIALMFIYQALLDKPELSTNPEIYYLNTYENTVSVSGVYVLSVVIYKIAKKIYVKYIKPRRMKNKATENQL